MELWRLGELDIEAHQPEVLHSRPEGRVVVLQLPTGEALSDHQVHERAWLVVLSGAVEIEADDRTEAAPAGSLATFAPKERHEVRATSDARLLLLLGPWPGDGHPGTRG